MTGSRIHRLINFNKITSVIRGGLFDSCRLHGVFSMNKWNWSLVPEFRWPQERASSWLIVFSNEFPPVGGAYCFVFRIPYCIRHIPIKMIRTEDNWVIIFPFLPEWKLLLFPAHWRGVGVKLKNKFLSLSFIPSRSNYSSVALHEFWNCDVPNWLLINSLEGWILILQLSYLNFSFQSNSKP